MIPHAVTTGPSWVGSTDAAAMLGISRQRLFQLKDAGRLHAVRYGPKTFLWDRRELEAHTRLAKRGKGKTAGNISQKEA